jgi:CheY-specific phosphatase CheX
MNDAIRSGLIGGVDHVMYQLGLLEEERGPLPVPDVGAEILCSVMQVGGVGGAGRLFLGVRKSLCARLVSLLFPDIPCNTDTLEDAVCELLNMVGESTRTLLSQQQITFDVGVPVLVTPPPPLPDGDDVVNIDCVGEPVHLWMV